MKLIGELISKEKVKFLIKIKERKREYPPFFFPYNLKSKKMKNTILLISIAFITLSCGYKRMGDLTMISNRNVDKSANCVLLERDVEVKTKSRIASTYSGYEKKKNEPSELRKRTLLKHYCCIF